MPRRTNNATNSLKTPPGVGISELLGGKQRTVWVGAWMHKGRLGQWKFRDVTMAEAVTMAKVLMAMEWAHMAVSMAKHNDGKIEYVNPFEVKNSLGEGVVFRASNKYLYACTKRALRGLAS